MHKISQTPRGNFSNEAERITGAVLASIDFNGKTDIELLGLHDYLDHIQDKINSIGEQIFDHYILFPTSTIEAPELPNPVIQDYQQQQQQQQ